MSSSNLMDTSYNYNYIERSSYLNKLEEAERKIRLQDDVHRNWNANKMATILKKTNLNILKPNAGANKYFKHIEERERMRLLNSPQELSACRLHGKALSNIIQGVAYPTLAPGYRAKKANSRRTEENERKRRMEDKDEARARKMNALEFADSIRTGASTIKARFVRRPRNPWQKAVSMMNWHSAISTLSDIFHKASSLAVQFVKPISDLDTIKNLEEKERARRIEEDPSGYARYNGKRIAFLLKHAPVHPLASVGGFRRFTRYIEEKERARRLANRSESEVRRMRAGIISNYINQLGWPFIRDAKGSFPRYTTDILEEDERTRRLSDPKGMFTARYNANLVASIIEKALLQPKLKNIARKYTRSLEEKERRHRIHKDRDHAIRNAHKLAQLIVNMGHPFFVPTESQSSKDIEIQRVDKLEDQERVRRLSTSEQIEAKRKARRVASLIKQFDNMGDQGINKKQLEQLTQEDAPDLSNLILQDIKLVEEQERKARIADKHTQIQALANAVLVSRMIRSQNPYRQGTLSPLVTPEMPSTISPRPRQVSVHRGGLFKVMQDEMYSPVPASAVPAH